MAQLPQQVTLDTMQNTWASAIEPLLNNALNKANLLTNIVLTAPGPNVINHKLGRKMQGYWIVSTSGFVQIYDSQPFNELTLTLMSDANVTVALAVY